MSDQAIFNHVIRFLRKQGVPALSDDSIKCCYRTKDGLKCAIGCLIADEFYDEELEGANLHSAHPRSQAVVTAVRNSGWEDFSLNLLCELQHIHDNSDPKEWEEHWQRVAEDFGLTMP